MMAALALRYWWAIVIAALVAAIGVQEMRITHAHSEFESYKLEVVDAQRKQAEAARQESDRRQRAVDEEAQRARAENAKLQAGLARANASAVGLQRDLAAFKRRASASTISPDGSAGQPDTRAIDLLSKLYLRADREAGILAQYADQLRAAGASCERAHEAVAQP